MTKLRPVEFKWRQFEPQLILMAVGWYLRFSLSYRDVEDLLQERGMSVDHVTVWRWVQRYAPELDRRLRSHLKPTNKSWRVDETYIRVKGKWTYLYRAVDSAGASIDFLLSARRDAAAAARRTAAGEIVIAAAARVRLLSPRAEPLRAARRGLSARPGTRRRAPECASSGIEARFAQAGRILHAGGTRREWCRVGSVATLAYPMLVGW